MKKISDGNGVPVGPSAAQPFLWQDLLTTSQSRRAGHWTRPCLKIETVKRFCGTCPSTPERKYRGL